MKALLTAVYDFIAAHGKMGCSAKQLIHAFKLSKLEREWIVTALAPCVEVFTDNGTGRLAHRVKAPFGAHLSPHPFHTRIRPFVTAGVKSREIYQHRFHSLVVRLLVEEGQILVVKDSFQKTRCQYRLFWKDDKALADSLRASIRKQQKALETTLEAKRIRNLKVTDPEGLARLEAYRHFKHLNQYHRDDVEQIVSMVGFFFEGIRCNPTEVMNITQRKLYHLSRELGWRRVKCAGWTHDLFGGELDNEGEPETTPLTPCMRQRSSNVM